jgi:hypothetical protein
MVEEKETRCWICGRNREELIRDYEELIDIKRTDFVFIKYNFGSEDNPVLVPICEVCEDLLRHVAAYLIKDELLEELCIPKP